jgi:hypothetical protein
MKHPRGEGKVFYEPHLEQPIQGEEEACERDGGCECDLIVFLMFSMAYGVRISFQSLSKLNTRGREGKKRHEGNIIIKFGNIFQRRHTFWSLASS